MLRLIEQLQVHCYVDERCFVVSSNVARTLSLESMSFASRHCVVVLDGDVRAVRGVTMTAAVATVSTMMIDTTRPSDASVEMELRNE